MLHGEPDGPGPGQEDAGLADERDALRIAGGHGLRPDHRRLFQAGHRRHHQNRGQALGPGLQRGQAADPAQAGGEGCVPAEGLGAPGLRAAGHFTGHPVQLSAGDPHPGQRLPSALPEIRKILQQVHRSSRETAQWQAPCFV